MTAPRLISRRIGAALVALSLLAAACGDDDGGAGLTTDDGVIDNTDTSGGAATTPPLPDVTPTPPESSTQPTVPPSPTASVAPEPTSEPVGGSLLEGGPVPALRLVPVGEVATPVAMANRAGSASLWIAEKRGVVRRLDETGADPVPVLDLSTRVSGGNEQGLLGLTFSPDGSRLYVDFTDTTGATNVVEYTMSGDIAGTETERTLLVVDQPAANHNAGALAFGPDGYLYVTLGDGGGGGDPFATGQDPGTLLGSILRLDPLADVAPYGIPPDNPFIDGGGRPEVFLYGVRNPWRISFDRSTGDLWIADVGQGDIEEIDVAYAADGGGLGANLGWSLVEGTQPFNGAGPPAEDYLAPVYEYTHDEGCSVTGGYVYRGAELPELTGVYLFGDYCTSTVWGLLTTASGGFAGRVDLGLQLPGGSLVSFGEDADGELYVLSLAGVVYRLEAG